MSCVTFFQNTLCIYVKLHGYFYIFKSISILNFQGIFNWLNGDPVSFQPWKNLNLQDNKLLQKYKISFPYQCSSPRRKETRIDQFVKICPWVRKGVYDREISKYKYADQKYLQPQIERQCTLMLLTNLAEPEWVSIKCGDRIIGDIMCMVPRNVNLTSNISLVADLAIFKNPCVLITGTCYLFSWGLLNPRSVSRNTKIKKSKSTLVAMEYLVTATNVEFPPFHFSFNLIIYCKISRKWILQNITEPHKGLHILMLPGSKYIRYENVFECGQGIYIAYAYVCDRKKDCPGDLAFDEIGCICKTSFILSSKCKYILDKEGIKSCSFFYLTLKDGTCLYYGLVKINSSLTATNDRFNCISNHLITMIIKNDLITDCLPNRDEAKHNFKDSSNIFCQENGQLPCKGGDRKCYNITEICIYRLNKNNLLIPCGNGEHVTNCRLIQCNMKFKCSEFYCIPWSYVCDGKWDCPGGYDEVKELNCGINRNCNNMFKCTNSQICIHVGDVCNGFKDCNGGDDEYMCSLARWLCPSPCVCMGLAIVCHNVNYANYLVSFPPYNAIFLSYCDLAFLEPLLKIIKHPTFLSIRYNNLKSLCKMLPGLTKTLTIDLGFNFITYVNPDCFRNGFQLISIKLNDNIISIFQRMIIFQLKSLHYLNLNNNFISALFLDYYVLVPDLEIVSIKNNRLSTISSRFFDDLNVKVIVTDNYFICCKSPSKSMCISVKLWFESCRHLLLQRSIRMCAFCYSFFLTFSNAFAVILQKSHIINGKDNYGVFQYLAISVYLVDLTWGVYLTFLVIFDFFFEDNFVIQESLWKSSFACFFLFSINLNFNILSPLLSIFISFSRLMVVIYPLNSNFRKRKFVLKCCILMYSLAAILVTAYMITFKHVYSSVPFRLCSPFIDPTNSNMMLTTVTFVVVCLQFIVYILNILISIKIFLELKRSVGQKHNITSLLTQFSILTISNTICWVPSGIIFLIRMFTYEFSIIMITWVVIGVTSVNSVTNSILFIVTTARIWRKQMTTVVYK